MFPLTLFPWYNFLRTTFVQCLGARGGRWIPWNCMPDGCEPPVGAGRHVGAGHQCCSEVSLRAWVSAARNSSDSLSIWFWISFQLCKAFRKVSLSARASHAVLTHSIKSCAAMSSLACLLLLCLRILFCKLVCPKGTYLSLPLNYARRLSTGGGSGRGAQLSSCLRCFAFPSHNIRSSLG